MKVQNLLFSSFLCLFLLGPISLFTAQNVFKVDLPGWFTAENVKYLTGDVADVSVRAHASISGFESGEFQSAFQSKVGTFVPLKATALLCNAALQRTFITLSNALWAWECYPTYFGAREVYIPDQEAITGIAQKESEKWTQEMVSFLKELNAYASSNPKVKFVVYLASSNDNYAQFNPTYNLVSNPRTFEDATGIVERFEEEESVSPNLVFLYPCFEDNDNYYRYYYRSDRHWNIRGTVVAYEDICEILGYPKLSYNNIVSLDGQLFIGDMARESLFPLAVPVEDVCYDFSGLEADFADGRSIDLGSHYEYDEANRLARLFNFYCLYYDVRYEATIRGGRGDKNILLVADSFGRSFSRLISESSKLTYRCSALYGDVENENDLASHLECDEIDAVVFVGTPDNYASFMARNPEFFSS